MKAKIVKHNQQENGQQVEPKKPRDSTSCANQTGKETNMRNTPRTITDLPRDFLFSESELSWLESQIPAWRMGIERSTVIMLRMPIKLMLERNLGGGPVWLGESTVPMWYSKH